ncbi:MAG: tRNA lysidine(34) synthetase TilS [Victivallaceae bacterium]|nr:tRNA lysidine(34) synthetase TilS [Victivallaceae bacterium]
MNYALCRQLFAKVAGRTLLSGFSGGADSTALLLVARKFAREFSIRLIAVHFNHRLRGEESDREAENAADFARKRDVEFECVDLDVPRDGKLEAGARAGRQAAWRTLLSRHGAEGVLLGHHADDKMENLFLRMGRGANVSGLTSLREISEVGGVTYLRPLLPFTRAEILDFLHGEKVFRFAEDSSNCDLRYFRNRLRGEILPALYAAAPGGRKGFSASLAALESEARYLESCAETYLREGDPETRLFWRNAPDALLPRLLRLHRKQKSGVDFIPTAGDVSRLREEVQKRDRRTREVTLSDGVGIVLSGNNFLFTAPPPKAKRWRWKSGRACFWGEWKLSVSGDGREKCAPFEALFDAEKLPPVLKIASPEPGETIVPFGRRTPAKIKKLRVDRKLPPLPVLPVLRDAHRAVVWAAGIRQSNLYGVGETTRHAVRLRIEKR